VTFCILIFFIYCFFGWIYESTLVSITDKHLVNRGFMHGPILPIYGVGALLCIGAGMLANGSLVLTFIYAVVMCTAVELGTGLAMEHLFKVRYWDYTHIPGNIHGYICPSVSLLWGLAALVITQFVQARVSLLVMLVPPFYAELLSYMLTIVCAIDFALSWAEAIDLRHTLEEFAENNRRIQGLRQRVDELQDVLAANAGGAREKVGNLRSDYSDNIRVARGYLLEVASDARDIVWDTVRDKTSMNHQASSQGTVGTNEREAHYSMGDRLSAYRSWQNNKLELAKGKLAEIPSAAGKLSAWAAATREDINLVEEGLRPHLPGQDHHVGNMLRRNPRAVSAAYAEELLQLKQLIDKDARQAAEDETPGDEEALHDGQAR
jgi:uncharacterized membrane protein